MRTEYYRIVIENGRVKINVFDKGSKSPLYSTEAKMTDKHGREIVALFLQKYGVGLREYKEICDNYDKQIIEDLKHFVGKNEIQRHNN